MVSAEITQLRRELERQRTDFERFAEVVAFEREATMTQMQIGKSPDNLRMNNEIWDIKERLRAIESSFSEIDPEILQSSLKKLLRSDSARTFIQHLARTLQESMSDGNDGEQDCQITRARNFGIPGEDTSSNESNLDEGEECCHRQNKIRVSIRYK